MNDTPHIPPAARWVKVADAGPDSIEEYDVILPDPVETSPVLQPRSDRAESVQP